VLLALDQPWTAALTVPHDAVRVSFAVPWQGMLLLGTTDTLYEGEPDSVEATDADVEQILAEAAVAIAPEVLRRTAVRSSFAGLRVLPMGDGSPSRARRETVFLRGRTGMLSVAGGKLRTDGRIALDTMRAPFGENAALVTVLDGHPATLSWLGAVARHRVYPLGVEHFGQSGDLPDLYRVYRLDADAIIDAVARALLDRR